MNDCASLIMPALERGLRDQVHFREDEGDCRVVVPFERSDGDMITLWVKQEGDHYRITDEGETYGFLYLSNIDLDQEKRSRRAGAIQERFGLDEVEGEVSLTATEENLGERVFDVIQAVQGLSYLTYTRRQYTKTDFVADVSNFLNDIGVKYNTRPKVEGVTEDHRVDFSILQQKQPTYLEALHADDASSAKAMAQRTQVKWTDIAAEDPNARRISVVDDESGEVGGDAERVLKYYSDAYVRWSQRDGLEAAVTA